jgi:hypothetical protein
MTDRWLADGEQPTDSPAAASQVARLVMMTRTSMTAGLCLEVSGVAVGDQGGHLSNVSESCRWHVFGTSAERAVGRAQRYQ